MRGVGAAAMCFLLSFGIVPARALGGQAGHPVPAKHAKAGVTCFDCHQEEVPSRKAVADNSCMACHGDFAAMADLTRELPVNPHATPAPPHPGPFTCTDCHRQHQPPVVKCLQCHPKFKFTAK